MLVFWDRIRGETRGRTRGFSMLIALNFLPFASIANKKKKVTAKKKRPLIQISVLSPTPLKPSHTQTPPRPSSGTPRSRPRSWTRSGPSPRCTRGLPVRFFDVSIAFFFFLVNFALGTRLFFSIGLFFFQANSLALEFFSLRPARGFLRARMRRRHSC